MDHFIHDLSIRAPKYIGARTPPATWDEMSIQGTPFKCNGVIHIDTFGIK